MNGSEIFRSIPAAQAVAWALVHFLWQGALLGLAAAGLLRATKNASAAARYAVAVGALFAMLALPVGTALRLAGSVGSAPTPGIKRASLSAAAPALAPARVTPSTDLASGFAPLRPVVSGLSALSAYLPPALPWIFGLWLAGVALLAVFHAGGWRQARRLIRSGRSLGGDLEERVRDLAGRLGVGRAIRLLESSAVAVPAVIGWLRPVILVPASTLTGLSPRQLDAILAHELAHVRRHDYLVNLLQAAVETLLFYHPAVWWVSAEVRRERENCCDDLAVAVCGDPLRYARALADLEGLRAPAPHLALAADGGSLLGRVRRLVGAPAPRSRRSWLAGVFALSILPIGLTFDHVRSHGDSGSDGGGSALSSAPGAAAGGSPSALDSPSSPPGPASPAGSGSHGLPVSETPGSPGKGTWTATRRGDKISLETSMSWGGGHHRSQTRETYAVSEFVGLTAGPEVRFELRRDAGTFRYEGRFQGEDGSGFFTFQGNPAYVREMAALGYQVSEDRQIGLALQDVSLAYVRDVQGLGYRGISLDSLEQFRIQGGSAQYIRDLAALGYRGVATDDLIQFRIQGVSPQYIRGLAAAGVEKLSVDDLTQFRIQGVSPEYVRGLSSLGYPLSAESLVQFRIQGVSPEYVRGLAAAGYEHLSAQDLLQFRIQGVKPGFIRDAVARYGKLSARDLLQLKISGRLNR